MCELAKRTGVSENYVSRILDPVVFPTEMTAIFGAHHDPSLTVAQLIAYARVLRI
jgi:hypothetical protein